MPNTKAQVPTRTAPLKSFTFRVSQHQRDHIEGQLKPSAYIRALVDADMERGVCNDNR